MCKLMMTAGVRPKYREIAWKFLMAAMPAMTKHDQDGVGYVAGTGTEIFGERWLNPKDAFKHRKRRSRRDAALELALGDAITMRGHYNSFGTLDWKSSAAMLLHTRMATCGKGIENTHPFVQGNTALIHNGVISNSRRLENITSTCDSECILNEYIRFDVAGQPENIELMAQRLEGYYACGVLTMAEGRQVLDIFKDARAQLVVGYIEDFRAWVYCTNEAILRETAKATKMRLGAVHTINEGHLIRIDVLTGKVLGVYSFDADAGAWARYQSAADAMTQEEREFLRMSDEDRRHLSEIEARVNGTGGKLKAAV